MAGSVQTIDKGAEICQGLVQCLRVGNATELSAEGKGKALQTVSQRPSGELRGEPATSNLLTEEAEESAVTVKSLDGLGLGQGP